MQLLIRRDQTAGLMGGIKFQLTAKASLDANEEAAVRKYKLGDTILYEKPTAAPDPGSAWSLLKHRFAVPRVVVNDLVAGKTIEAKDILDIMAAEEQLKEAARSFHLMLNAAAGFGGEVVHTFDAQ